jgi:hypothetical protein
MTEVSKRENDERHDEKATPLQPPADGSLWSGWTVPHRSEWVRRHDEYAADGSLDPRWIKVLENAKVTLNLND